jgi:hypothetical protein
VNKQSEKQRWSYHRSLITAMNYYKGKSEQCADGVISADHSVLEQDEITETAGNPLPWGYWAEPN